MSGTELGAWPDWDAGQAGAPTHVIDVELTAADYEEHTRDQFLNDPDSIIAMSRERRNGIRGLACFVCFAAALSLIAYRLIEHELGTIEIVAALGMAAYSMYVIVQYVRCLRYFSPRSRAFDLWVQSAGQAAARRTKGDRFRLTVRPDRISAVYPTQRSEWRWTEVEHIVHAKGTTLIGLEGVGTLIVPHRCLPSGLTPDEFVRSLRALKADVDRKSGHQGTTEFALTDAACPNCKYTVGPLSQNVCPECGRRMSAESFRIR
ncbi:MAG: hypothetical protein KF768_08930 [Phycisphaeraceae bacterium]|nr:hypothetical protein [Phycisphaeraceae bacterium]